VEPRKIILFLLFTTLTVGSVAVVTETFYIAPMTITVPTVPEPVTVTGDYVAWMMAVGALVALLLLLRRG